MESASKKVPICRGSLAWLGRQTHNLENINGGQTPLSRSRGLEAKIKRDSRSRHHLFLMLMLFVDEIPHKKQGTPYPLVYVCLYSLPPGSLRDSVGACKGSK